MQYIRTRPVQPPVPVAPANGEWKTIGRGPHVTTMGIAVGPDLKFPIIHRSAAVRSAKDCWSLPSGLHENGLSIVDQLAVELDEELGIKVVRNEFLNLGFYENISAEDSYHWVIHVFVVMADLTEMVNREPDKHDQVQLVHLMEFPTLVKTLRWAPGLGEFLARSFKPDNVVAFTERGF